MPRWFVRWLRELHARIAGTAPRRRRGRGRGRRSTPALELLEARCLPSVYSVTSTADSGAGTLRQALLNANSNPGTDTIVFQIGNGSQAIRPASALPTITGAV